MLLRTIIICSIIYLANAEICKHYLGQLGDLQSKLIYCITTNSVPVTMCISCQDLYGESLHAYDLLATNCSDIYFNKDRINLVQSTQSAVTSLWSKAYCDDCFNNNNKKIFYEKNQTLSDCLVHPGGDPCEKCQTKYLDLNNFYISLDQRNNGEVCYDLQDQMNRTRKTWSKELKCCRREKNMTLFLVAVGITCCLPVLFYVTTFLLTKRQELRYRVLFDDEDRAHSSELPSTSRRRSMNDINNPPQQVVSSQSQSIEHVRPVSNANTNNTLATDSLKTTPKKQFYLSDDLESSDDEMLKNATIAFKEK